MRRFAVAAFVLALVALLALPVSAQRGGGGGRGGSMGDAVTRTSFESPDKALAFPVPPDLTLFTPEAPGRLGQLFRSGYAAYMLNLLHDEVAIGVKPLPGATEADFLGVAWAVENKPPQAKQPGYKKVSAGFIKIGLKQDKDALDYVYTANNAKNEPITTRQVMFLHGGKGYVITCTAAEKDFAATNKKDFDVLFQKLELR
ncbi:MAG: hypothetical protein ACM3NQ_12820 [Bacteroidales bacterium]